MKIVSIAAAAAASTPPHDPLHLVRNIITSFLVLFWYSLLLSCDGATLGQDSTSLISTNTSSASSTTTNSSSSSLKYHPRYRSLVRRAAAGSSSSSSSSAHISCYSCMFLHEAAQYSGQASCDDPFQHFDIPAVICNGPCGKLYRKLDKLGEFQITRGCLPNCKERNEEGKSYTKCCNGKLCNSSPSVHSLTSYGILAIVSLALTLRVHVWTL